MLLKYKRDEFFNGMVEEDGETRPHYRAVRERLGRTAPEEFEQRRRAVDLAFLRRGVTFNVYGDSQGAERIRTTAESHRRIAIVEVMGRHSGYIALGSAYGRPDLILILEQPVDLELLAARVKRRG